MSLTDFKPHFDNAYQEIFQKVLVAKKIANLRFEPTLKFGESVERVAYDISGVRVRSVVRGSASTIDAITDSSELLTINYEKEAVFHISDGEVKQVGPLNPGEVIGGKIAMKVAIDFDAYVLAETVNAAYTFDTGDLTTLSSSGVPITISSTTTPQFVMRAPAKLRKNNQTLTNLCFVTDSYAAADLAQYLLSKDIDLASSIYKNGETEMRTGGAEVYISENLTATTVLGMATNATAGDTVTHNGLTYTIVASPSAAGDVDLGADADTTRANLTAAFNQGAGAGTAYIAWTGANLITWEDGKITATNDNTANTMTVVSIGTGAVTVSETLIAGGDSWTTNYINCYFGKKGGIDAVVQDLKEVDMRQTADRRGTNVFSSLLGGYKTYADGAKQFLNVKLAR